MQDITGQIPAIDPSTMLVNVSMTLIIINIIAGLIGTIYFLYGKKTLNIPMIISGIFLCIVPYFISNTPLLIIACLLMLAAPYIVNRYV